MKSTLFSYVTSAVITLVYSVSIQAEEQVIAGAGPSTKIVQLFVQKFSKNPVAHNVEFKVPTKSAKHAGGIKASSKFLFGRTGRPLNVKEKRMKKEEIILARIPIAFATGSGTGVSYLNMQQVEGLFTGKNTKWSEVGGTEAAVVLIGREPTEALFTVLKKSYPSFEDAKFNKIFKKDHAVVRFLNSPDGENAIAFGARPNFDDVNVVEVEGFSTGVAVGLVYDLKNKGHALVKAAQAYAASPEWAVAVEQAGMLPPL